MSKYRLATIWPRKAYDADITEIIELKLKDPISQLIVTDEATNGSAAGQQGHPAKCITKIELVDGSDVLYSLDGREAQAVDFYHNKKLPANLVLYPNDMNSEIIYPINFGRKLWDPVLALDPKRFSNLQLKITLDENGGGKNVDGHYLTVLAKVFDEKAISPVGFFMCKEIKSYTMSASGHEYIDLPIDYPHRMLFIRSHVAGTGPDYQFESIKLHQDNGKHVLFDNIIGEILRVIQSEFPMVDEWVITDPPTPGGTMSVYITPGYWPTALAQEWLAPTSANNVMGCYSGDGGRLQVSTASGWTSNAQIHVKGWCPHSTLAFPLGDLDDMGDWFDPPKGSSVELDIKGHGSLAAATCEIFLQQFRKY